VHRLDTGVSCSQKRGKCRKISSPEIRSNDCFKVMILIPSLILSWELIVQKLRQGSYIQGMPTFPQKGMGFSIESPTFIRPPNRACPYIYIQILRIRTVKLKEPRCTHSNYLYVGMKIWSMDFHLVALSRTKNWIHQRIQIGPIVR
jgi:hypothetical protein